MCDYSNLLGIQESGKDKLGLLQVSGGGKLATALPRPESNRQRHTRLGIRLFFKGGWWPNWCYSENWRADDVYYNRHRCHSQLHERKLKEQETKKGSHSESDRDHKVPKRLRVEQQKQLTADHGISQICQKTEEVGACSGDREQSSKWRRQDHSEEQWGQLFWIRNCVISCSRNRHSSRVCRGLSHCGA